MAESSSNLATQNFSPDEFLGNAAELLFDRYLSESFPEARIVRKGKGNRIDYRMYDPVDDSQIGRTELKSRHGFGKLPATLDTIRKAVRGDGPKWLASGLELSRDRKTQSLIDSARSGIRTYLAVLLTGDMAYLIYEVDPDQLESLKPRQGGRYDRGRKTDIEDVVDIPWQWFQRL